VSGQLSVRRKPQVRLFVALAVLALAVVLIAILSSRSNATDDPVAAPDPSAAAPASSPSPSPLSSPSVSPSPEPEPSPSEPVASPEPSEESPDLDPPFDVLDPVELDEEASFTDGVEASLVAIEATSVGAKGPGEIAGKGVLVTVRIKNTTEEPISLDEVVVDLYDEDGAPAVLNYGDSRTDEFSSTLKPGKSRKATYVARLAEESSTVTVTVAYKPGAPAVSFTGRL
jgi:hypothetical protein